jgi:hypothetical protein
LRTVTATRYVTPLREGGSLPGLVEADDDGLYVLKFRGAGQGAKALVAEVIAGELARAIGLPVPELVLVELDPALGRAEPDPEIQELIEGSAGLNVGIDFLPGALPFDAQADLGADLAADVVWFDALVTNVDRTPRNPNLLCWHRRLWLIDHGAALYLHHQDGDFAAQARRPFPLIAEHVLLPFAGPIGAADERLAACAGDAATLDGVVDAVPAQWLDGDGARAAYAEYLRRRLAPPREFVEEAERARAGA